MSVTVPAPMAESSAASPGTRSLLRGPFTMLCVAAFGFYVSLTMFLSSLPVYAADHLRLDQGEIGVVIGAFAVFAMLCKPHAGWALDALGRRPVLLVGGMVFPVASALYAAAGAAWSLLLVRGLHGVGMGLFPTAGAAMVADLVPPGRRGEGMGYFSATGSLAFAVAPVAGTAIVEASSFPVMCLVAAGIALGSLALAWRLPETGVRVPTPPPPLTVDGLFSRTAMLPSAVLFCLFLGYGGILIFFPLMARQVGLRNPGWFFTVMATVILILRAKGGSLSDRFGRVAVIAPSLICCGLALAVLGFLRSPGAALAAGCLYAAGFGLASPALMAMATDGVPPEERGRAMGTLQTAWEMGIAGGGILLGQVLAWSGGHFGLAYAVAGAVTIGGAALALARRR